MSHYAERRQARSSAAAARPIILVVVPANAWLSPGYYFLIIYPQYMSCLLRFHFTAPGQEEGNGNSITVLVPCLDTH